MKNLFVLFCFVLLSNSFDLNAGLQKQKTQVNSGQQAGKIQPKKNKQHSLGSNGMASLESESVLHGQDVHINSTKSYLLNPNQVTAKAVWNDETNSYDTVYVLSGKVGISGQTANSYSRTISVTDLGNGSYQVNGVINQSASDKVPEGTTYTQVISPVSTGGYLIQGTTSTGGSYSATISYQSNEEMGTAYAQGGGYSLQVTYTIPDGESSTKTASIPSEELDSQTIIKNFNPELE